MSRSRAGFSDCSGSVSGHDTGGTTDGTCTWCGVRIDPRQPRPAVQGYEPSDLREAYDYYHDPDFGTLTQDQIRKRYSTGRES